MEYVIVFTFIVLAVLLAVKLEAKQKTKAIDNAFKGRDALSKESYYQRFFREKGVPINIAVGVREILEEQLSADLSRLNGTDDFSKNLAFFWEFDSMADVEIVCALEERFGVKIEDQEAQSMRTVEEIVRTVHDKVMRNA